MPIGSADPHSVVSANYHTAKVIPREYLAIENDLMITKWP
jgi:hypothetical protein